jgi:hypothetical protein
MTKKNSHRVDGPFMPNLREMKQSPAFRVLTLAERRVLDRLEIEWLNKGGYEGSANGKLIVTFAQFEEYGVRRNSIAPAIRGVVALGFTEVTQQGRAGNADFRRPSEYRITYYPTVDAGPTHEWRQISEDDARMIAQGVKRPGSNSANSSPPKKQKTTPRNDTEVGNETAPSFGPRNDTDLGPRNDTKFPPPETAPLSRSYPSPSLGAEARAERVEPVVAMAAMSEINLLGAGVMGAEACRFSDLAFFSERTQTPTTFSPLLLGSVASSFGPH